MTKSASCTALTSVLLVDDKVSLGLLWNLQVVLLETNGPGILFACAEHMAA